MHIVLFNYIQNFPLSSSGDAITLYGKVLFVPCLLDQLLSLVLNGSQGSLSGIYILHKGLKYCYNIKI